MMTKTVAMVIVLAGLSLLVACRAPGAAPESRAIEPGMPAIAYAAPIPPTDVPADSSIVSETSFAEMGLIWRECEVSQKGYTDWREAEACFGHAAPEWSEEDKRRSGMRTERGLRLTIDGDVYQIRDYDLNVVRWSTLTRNGWPIRVLPGGAMVHPPNISLRDIAGKVAWEFAGELQKTIIYGGKDMRALYGLDAAYRPYGIDGKLVFVGEKDGSRFVMVDGKRLGPEFDEIIVAYCCEPVMYSVRFGEGRYAFWGTRGGRHYVVELTAE